MMMKTAKKYAQLSLIYVGLYVAYGCIKVGCAIGGKEKMHEYLGKFTMKKMGGFMMTRADHEAGKKPGSY